MDLFDDIADTIEELAKVAAMNDDPKRNVLGHTSHRLAIIKERLAEQLRKLIPKEGR